MKMVLLIIFVTVVAVAGLVIAGLPGALGGLVIAVGLIKGATVLQNRLGK